MLLATPGTGAAAEGSAPLVVTSGWSEPGKTAYATCPQGTTLVGGGYNSDPTHLGSGQVSDAVDFNAPSSASSRPNTWGVQMDKGQAEAYAMCSKDSDQAPVVVASDWSKPAQAVYATCPQGTSLIGGGYDSKPVHLGSGAVADAVNASVPSASTPNSWAIRMDKGVAKAYVMCSKDSDQAPVVVASDGWSEPGKTAYATCPQGTSLIGGGYNSEPTHTGDTVNSDAVDLNAPSSASSMPNTWGIRMDKGLAQAYAMCSKDSDQAPVVVASDWSKPAKAAYATCPQGTTLAGAGYDSKPAHLGFGAVADAVNASVPSASTPNSWAIRMDIGQAKAYVMCTK
ncbi:hypothetical protein ACWDCL_27250 [Streptomyces sp. NPDC001009]